MKQKIYPCLWFDNEAEDAAKFYTAVFKDSRILETAPYLTKTPSNKPVGSVLTVSFELNGQKFIALNGGSFFKINEAVSFVIECKDQEEIDYYWGKLSAVPESEQCGWCKDKFGVSWQVVPESIDELTKSKEGMEVLLEMKKIDIKKLEEAGEGGGK
jgi:predicted 3-demethylubiquinone-9 3-methyltransferase (glyoxalase superfamily)